MSHRGLRCHIEDLGELKKDLVPHRGLRCYIEDLGECPDPRPSTTSDLGFCIQLPWTNVPSSRRRGRLMLSLWLPVVSRVGSVWCSVVLRVCSVCCSVVVVVLL